jgi:putative tryptophan/tyrosine transport system substrate-binding protein
MNMKIKSVCLILITLLFSCRHATDVDEQEIPLIGFLDYVEDATLELARKGFIQALSDSGFSEEKRTLKVIYRNAQGDQPTLLQAADYLISRKPALIATNTTLSTINTVKRTKDIPVFMMVAPRPDIAKLTDASGKGPSNLHGVYETLGYIDTSARLIRELFPKAKTAGTIYNPAESQSADALARLEAGCNAAGIRLISMPVTSSSESQLVTEALLNKKVDVFFALPDNILFSSFEVVSGLCAKRKVPIVTSEAGLVARGALASYGADFYQWGYQSGRQAAAFLKNPEGSFPPEEVKVRRKVINPGIASEFGISVMPGFEIFKPE